MNVRNPFIALGIVLAATAAVPSQSAFAISVELAKKCRDMAIKAHPYDLPGAKKGNAAAERSYFNDCVAKGGNMSETQQPSGTGDNIHAAPAHSAPK